jgi:hypothetical protein
MMGREAVGERREQENAYGTGPAAIFLLRRLFRGLVEKLLRKH